VALLRTCGSPIAGKGDAFGDFAAAFRGRRQDQIGRGHGGHLDVQVDAVEERTGDAALIVGGAAGIGAAPAGEAGLRGASAAARVHRRNQHEARRIGHAVIGARDRNLAGLQRLAQRVEGLRLEFRELVEEQDAMMGERDFSRSRMQAAADQRRHAGRVVRCAERPAIGQRAALDFAGDRGDHRDFEELGRRERRENRRQPCRQAIMYLTYCAVRCRVAHREGGTHANRHWKRHCRRSHRRLPD
jgi:hypothetical protein